MARDYHALPPDLPVPADDGAAAHLTGSSVPAVTLRAADGSEVDLAAPGLLVVYAYPRTGTPGIPLIEGWDEIPGARGCTPENCAFRDLHDDMRELGATVYGLSSQPFGEMEAFAEREHMPYPLLNDEALVLQREMGLPTFEAGGLTLYKRLTFIARDGRIEKVFYPVFPPDTHAADVLAYLRS
ncbi:MAG: peroxiredoxin [Thermoleophilaceae bacterium]